MTQVTIRKKPNSDIHQIQGEVRLKDCFRDWDLPIPRRRFKPVIDVADTENMVVIEVEIPGCKAEEIEVSIEDNVLIISGMKKEFKQCKKDDYCHIESACGSFSRNLVLPFAVDPNGLKTNGQDGVLSITIPKPEKIMDECIKVQE
jgi:HSP20 family protein